MTAAEPTPSKRIGRPPKVDEHGTPTRERLLNAAIDVCVENGYEGVTLSEIARRADVSTPAVYSHFTGKAELLVEASKRELTEIGTGPMTAGLGLRAIARRWLHPDFEKTRILVGELHLAAVRHPEVGELLDQWHVDTADRFAQMGSLSPSQIKMMYILLMGTTHLDSLDAVEVPQDAMEGEITLLIEGWLAERYAARS